MTLLSRLSHSCSIRYRITSVLRYGAHRGENRSRFLPRWTLCISVPRYRSEHEFRERDVVEGREFGAIVALRHSVHHWYFRRIPDNRATTIDRSVRWDFANFYLEKEVSLKLLHGIFCKNTEHPEKSLWFFPILYQKYLSEVTKEFVWQVLYNEREAWLSATIDNCNNDIFVMLYIAIS